MPGGHRRSQSHFYQGSGSRGGADDVPEPTPVGTRRRKMARRPTRRMTLVVQPEPQEEDDEEQPQEEEDEERWCRTRTRSSRLWCSRTRGTRGMTTGTSAVAGLRALLGRHLPLLRAVSTSEVPCLSLTNRGDAFRLSQRGKRKTPLHVITITLYPLFKI